MKRILTIVLTRISLLVKNFLEWRYSLPFNRLMSAFVIQDLTEGNIKKLKKPLDKNWRVVFIDMTENELYIFEKTQKEYQAAIWKNQQVTEMVTSLSMSDFEIKLFDRIERRNKNGREQSC